MGDLTLEPIRCSECTECNGAGFTTGMVDGEWRAQLCPHCAGDCGFCREGDIFFTWIGDPDVRPGVIRGYEYEFVKRCWNCGPPRKAIDCLNQAKLPAQHDPSAGRPLNREQAQLFRFCRKWLDDYQPGCQGFTFSGPVGMGKTHAMGAVIRSLCTQGLHAEYAVQTEIFTSLKRKMDEYGGSPSHAITELVKVPVLGIDEVTGIRDERGVWSYRTEWQLEIMTELLHTRYTHRKTTIITTNLNEQGLAQLFGGDIEGKRIVSRLNQWAPIVQVAGPDVRSNQSARNNRV